MKIPCAYIVKKKITKIGQNAANHTFFCFTLYIEEHEHRIKVIKVIKDNI